MERPLFIAEVKTESPFGFKSDYTRRYLLDIAIEHGDIVAIHTNRLWGGDYARLEETAKILDKVGYPTHQFSHKKKPLLIAKGIHKDDKDVRLALDCGADLVLVVGRRPTPDLAPVCIWEPSCIGTFAELAVSGRTPLKIMWNERDLETGKRRRGMESFSSIRNCYSGWLCQASFIKTPADVHPKADAFIVGQYLPEFVRELGNV